jgi:predicted O-methyltransferase YrrM
MTKLDRRQFVQTTSTIAGLAALGAGGSRAWGADAAAPATAPKGSEAIEKLLAELESKRGDFLSVPRKDGQLLNLLVKALRARSVLELGTSQGYSTIWISLALEETGGKLTTVELLPDRSALAKEHLAAVGLAHRVTFKQGDAHEIVPTLDGPFDFVFCDADKEGQPDYFKKLHPKKLMPGGLIAVHNAIRSRGSMRDYFDLVTKAAEFDTVVVSATMDDGFALSYRRRL